MDVLLNGDMVDFNELSLLEFDGVSALQYGNTSKYSFIFNSGVSVTVEGQQELLGLVTLVPTTFKGMIAINLNKLNWFQSCYQCPFFTGSDSNNWN